MTISRVNGGGWSIGDKVTSTQANSLDLNPTYSLDKRSGQTDTLESVVTASGAGRLIPTVVTGADANTTYLVSGGAVIRCTSAITAARAYTLSATNANTGDIIYIFAESSLAYTVTVKDQASATIFEIGNGVSDDGQWASFMYVGGWRLYQGGQGSRQRAETFTSSGTWVCPRGVTQVTLIACGGGGGGGGGASGDLGANPKSGGGSGSGAGGALVVMLHKAVTPGASYAYVIGAGGSGGALVSGTNVAGNAGSNGGDTTFDGTTFYGAMGGGGGVVASASAHSYKRGGSNSRVGLNGNVLSTDFADITSLAGEPILQQQGGFGYRYPASAYATSPGYAGHSATAAGGSPGASGTVGTGGVGGTYGGGGGGGGGGASGFVGAGAANGGAGGNGASDPTNGYPGTTGGTGAMGGGGGGGGGGGAGNGGTAGDGAAGGSGGGGILTILYVK
jgi:hypothetical protein